MNLTTTRRVTLALVAVTSLALGGCEPDDAPDAEEPDIRSDEAASTAMAGADVAQAEASSTASSSSA